MEKLKRFSFLLATVFILGALAMKMFRPEWQIYYRILTGFGVAFFILSLYFERHGLKNFFSARSTRYGLNSVVMVILVLAIVIVANWIAARHPVKYDTTKDKTFSLSSLTINALKNLKQPVKITAFYAHGDDDTSRSKMEALLEDYQRHSQQLEVRLIDPKKNLPLVRQYEINVNGTTVIESGGQKTTITSTDEEDITNSILKVSTDKQITIYFLQGHKEPSISDMDVSGLSAVSEEIKKSNYAIKELGDLAAKSKVPDDCDALIIVSPAVALLDHEIKAIQNYAEAGGRVLILDDPRSDPSVGKIFAPYRVQSANDIVVDESCNFPLAGPVVPCGVPKQGITVTREFDNRALLFFPETKSLSHQEAEDSGLVFTTVAESTDRAWGETDKVSAVYEEEKDKKGPLILALQVTRKIESEKRRSEEMRLAIFGDSSFTQNQFVNWSPWNYQLFSNTVAWLTEQENLIHLPPKTPQTDVMTLSSTQFKYIALLVVIGMPLTVLGTGIAVWMRRKKL